MIATPAVVPASIPSPSTGTWDVFGFDLRAYALCIMAGIVLAIWLGNKRWLARGGEPGVVADVAVWAVPFGIVGGRLYHVITDNQLYFREGRDPWQALRIWEGGLGIWGAIAAGALGVWIACRRRGVPFAAMADTLAPGVLIAQAVGRWGNWFNQELFGRPTDLPWGLEIDPVNRPAGYADVATFHPTFLYESLWALGLAFLLMWLDRRYAIGYGRLFALYVAGYTLGRMFWEYLRIDPANEVFGLRVNLWVSGLIFVAAIAYFFWSLKKHPGREEPEALRGFYDQADPFDDKAKNGDDEAPLTLPDDDDDTGGDGDGEKKPADDGDKVTAAVGAKAKTEATAESKGESAAGGDTPAAGEKPAATAKTAATKAPAEKPAEGEKVAEGAATTGTAKKAAAKKAPAKTAAAKKAPAKSTPATTAAKTTAAKTTAAKKTPAKKATASGTAAAGAAKKAPAARKAPVKKAAPAADSTNTPDPGH